MDGEKGKSVATSLIVRATESTFPTGLARRYPVCNQRPDIESLLGGVLPLFNSNETHIWTNPEIKNRAEPTGCKNATLGSIMRIPAFSV